MRHPFFPLAFASLALALAPIASSGAIDIDEDLEFAKALVNYQPSFTDYAKLVVEKILREDPSQKDKTRIVEVEIAIHGGDLATAEKIASELGTTPAGDAARLAIALQHFQRGNMDKGRELYNEFFSRYDQNLPEDGMLKRSYQEAAYTYAQLLRGAGDYLGAADNYARVERAASDPGQKRSMQVEASQAYVRAAEETQDAGKREEMLQKAAALCEKIQWGGLDMQFVDSIVTLANIEIVRGKPDEAEKTLMNYMDVIKPIDEAMAAQGLPMKDSPMAGARSLLGRLRRQNAEKLEAEGDTEGALKAYSGALSEYYNVFVKYGESKWGQDAGVASKEIKTILEDRFGKTVKIDLPDTFKKTASQQEFAMAGTLFRQQKYRESAEEYLKVLSDYPESGEPSVNALGTLAQCYYYLEDPLYAQVVASYLGERFGSKSERAGDTLSSLISLFDKRANEKTKAGDAAAADANAAVAKKILDTYIKYCPKHRNAGQFLFYFAQKALQASRAATAAGDTASADAAKKLSDAYFGKIVSDYTEDAVYPKAISQFAWTAYQNKDYAGAIGGMKQYIAESRNTPGPNLAQAMFALADCYRRAAEAKDMPPAKKSQYQAASIKAFQALINELSTKADRYAKTDADKAKVEQLLENSRFFMAYTFSKLPLERFGPVAVSKLDEFLASHPKSPSAPKALSVKGSIQMKLKDPGANDTYARLARDYPDTEEGKNAQYTRIAGALDIGLVDQAKEAFGAMVSDKGHYTTDEFVRVGQLMLDNGLWAEAAQAFELVLADANADEQYLQRAYFGEGKSQFELGNNEKAVENLGALLDRWPSSGLFYDAKFMLARANLKENDTVAAKTALNDILRYARDPVLGNDANLLYADLYLQEDDKTQALAAYKRIEVLGSMGELSEREREQVQDAILKAIDLAKEMDGFQGQVLESCDKFLELFPTSQKAADVRRERTAAENRLRLESLDAAPEGGDAGAAGTPAA